MQDASRRHKRTNGANADRATGGAKHAGDAGSDKLRRAGSKLGNDELQQRIQKGNATRDQLMQFLFERLQTMRDVQKREVALSDERSMRDHWKAIGDPGRAEITAPDPTRWHEAAGTYEEAAAQLARGALGRGTQLVERAMDQEQKQFDSLTSLVKAEDVERDLSGPGGMAPVDARAACAATDLPADVVALAREIQGVTERPEATPHRRRTRDPWWTEEEEEEEEEGAAGG